MAPIDIIVLLLIAVAFVAVCIRMYRKGSCADCAQGGYCTGHCSSGKKRGYSAVRWHKNSRRVRRLRASTRLLPSSRVGLNRRFL